MVATDIMWINCPTGCIGIVLTENDDGEKKAYIRSVLGHNEKSDVYSIMNHGGKIVLSQAQKILEHLS